MAEIRETHVERDADGNVIDRRVVVDRPKKKGGFGFGMLLGVVLVAGAIIAFAYSQGSFQQAGVEADQAQSQIEAQAIRLEALQKQIEALKMLLCAADAKAEICREQEK